jgi:cyclopropane fatty-acyl-phospholipid synthase-like methyltransferase
MIEEKRIIGNIIKSYSENIGFIVYTAEELQRLLGALGIDPKSTHRSIFDMESMSHHLQSEVVKLIKMMNITKEDLVLDAGCGNGAPTRLIAKTCGCRIIGFDVNPNQIKKAIDCDRLEGVDHLIERRVMDVHKIDLPSETFDKIFHNETMGHWMDKKTALAGLYRVMKKGGIMGFHEWLRGNRGDLNSAGGNFRGIYAEDVFFQHSLDEINQLLKDAGFTLLHSEDTTDIVDRQLRAKQREVEISKDYYIKSGLEEFFYKSINYCKAMIETHYDYLKYGRFLCTKK